MPALAYWQMATQRTMQGNPFTFEELVLAACFYGLACCLLWGVSILFRVHPP